MAYRGVKDLQTVRKPDEAALASASELVSKISKLKALGDVDKQLISTLQERIHQQKKELENRTMTIGAIQRNFENLSALAIAERKELEKLREAEVKAHQEREMGTARQQHLIAELEELRKTHAQNTDASQARDSHTHETGEASCQRLEHLKCVNCCSPPSPQSTKSELTVATKKAAEERGKLHAKLDTCEQRLAATDRNYQAAVARADEAERRARDGEAARLTAVEAASANTQEGEKALLCAAEVEAALQQALRNAQSALEDERRRGREAENAVEARGKSAEELHEQAALLRKEVQQQSTRADSAEQAMDAAKQQVERAGTLAAKGISGLRSELSHQRDAAKLAAEGAASALEAMESQLEAAHAEQREGAESAKRELLQRLEDSREEAMVSKVQLEAARAQVEEAETSYRRIEQARARAEAALKEERARAEATAHAMADSTAASRKLDAAEAKVQKLRERVSELASQQRKAEAAAQATLQTAQEEAARVLAEEKGRAGVERQRIVDELDERLRTVTQREAALSSAIKKVMHAEEAMEACLTCMACMGLMSEPETCVPCGHTFCGSCLSGAGGKCPECDCEANPAVKVGMLGTLVSKFGFQKQALSTLVISSTASAAAAKFAAGAVGSRSAA